KVGLDPLDRPAKWERSLVGVTHRRAGILTRVERLVGREPAKDRLINPALRHFLAIHEQHAGAALANAAAVIRELEADGVLAGRQWVLAGDLEPLDGEIVVLVIRLAILDEEGVATDVAAGRDQYAVGPILWDLHLRGEGVGLVLHVRRRAFRHPPDAGEV